MRKIDSIVVHHTVNPPQNIPQAEAVNLLNNSTHSENGIAPYHKVIGNTWAQDLRPHDLVGYHAGNLEMNKRSIAVVLMGNFNVDTITEFQKKELAATLKTWMLQYGIKRERVFLHKEVRIPPFSTACPGNAISQFFISKLLEPSMSIEQELVAAKEEIRKLNTELGVVTPQRDKALDDLKKERLEHYEDIKQKEQNYKNWQEELDKRKAAEALLQPLKDKIEKAKADLA